MTNHGVLLDVRQLTVSLNTERGPARILEAVDLAIKPREVHGLVGESGCGKSTLVKAILGLFPTSSHDISGEILFKGRNLLKLSEHELNRDIRAKCIGFVPQDPFQSFNPLFKVGTQILEAMRWSPPRGAKESTAGRRKRLIDILKRVRIPEPEVALVRYPHEFSGGQLQRLTIACAVACEPDLILADEPTSALDVTTQQQILAILSNLAKSFDVAVLLVTHDLGVVAQSCDAVTVMYAGQTIETMPIRDLIGEAGHPYARKLLACHPDRDGALSGIPGLVPGLSNLPEGCRFHPRCDQAWDACAARQPERTQIGESHMVRCKLYEPQEAVGTSLGLR